MLGRGLLCCDVVTDATVKSREGKKLKRLIDENASAQKVLGSGLLCCGLITDATVIYRGGTKI